MHLRERSPATAPPGKDKLLQVVSNKSTLMQLQICCLPANPPLPPHSIV